MSNRGQVFTFTPCISSIKTIEDYNITKDRCVVGNLILPHSPVTDVLESCAFSLSVDTEDVQQFHLVLVVRWRMCIGQVIFNDLQTQNDTVKSKLIACIITTA